MHTRLCQALGDDSGLLKLDTKPSVNDWMQEASVQTSQEVVTSIVSCEEVLVEYFLPGLLLDLLLEEHKEVVIVLFLPKISLESVQLMHVPDD